MEEQLQNFYKELYEEELDSNQEELDSDEEELDKMNEDKLDFYKEITDVDEDANQNSKKLIKSEESTESEESQESEESTESEESQESEESTESEESQESEESTESEESQESEESTESEESQESEESTESEESQESEESTESEESQESEESTESEESQESEESTESEESQESEESTESKKSTNFFIKKRESILFNMISHLRKMENEEKFHTYSIEKLFTPGISKLLKESGVNSMKDLLDFENLPNLTLFFANKERGEFDREFCRLFSYFHNLNNFRKSDYSHPEDSILLLFGNKNPFKDWLLNMIYRLKKMENEKKFHLYPIDKWFTPGVSRLLKKSGINNMKDLLDFENVSFLLLPFPNKETREFTVEFSRFHSIFYLLDKIDKKKKNG